MVISLKNGKEQASEVIRAIKCIKQLIDDSDENLLNLFNAFNDDELAILENVLLSAKNQHCTAIFFLINKKE